MGGDGRVLQEGQHGVAAGCSGTTLKGRGRGRAGPTECLPDPVCPQWPCAPPSCGVAGGGISHVGLISLISLVGLISLISLISLVSLISLIGLMQGVGPTQRRRLCSLQPSSMLHDRGWL